MALPPRRVGETKEQYSRRIGRNPRTIGGRRRRRLVDPVVGTPNRRKRPTVDPRRRRRKPLTPEQRANLSNLMEQARKRVKQSNRSRSIPKPVGSRQKPLTPEQRKKIRESMEGGRRRFREVLKRAGVLRRPKTTRSTITAPVKKQRRPR